MRFKLNLFRLFKLNLFSSIAITILGLSLMPAIAHAQSVPDLEPELPYAAVRQQLLDAGWQTVEPAEVPPQTDTITYLVNDLGYTELEDCAGTGMGFCRFEFVNADGQKLILVTIDNQRDQEPLLYRWWTEEQINGSQSP